MKCKTVNDMRMTLHPKYTQQWNWKRALATEHWQHEVRTVHQSLQEPLLHLIFCESRLDDSISQKIQSLSSLFLQATTIGNKVYIFGGEDRSRRAVADLYVLDMTSLQWSKPDIQGPVPTARSAHIACAVEDRFLLVFGGGSVARCFNDVWAYDTETSNWSSLKPAGPAPVARAGEVPTYRHTQHSIRWVHLVGLLEKS